ncbi:hypothetical protein ABEB36_015469 [Hypothenemus hampei]|uniref:MADF domain-containing protein n=1 Tax=Hypothenemus hampei TaxID=57062 RepID=A0ABD1E278_HYPHA
MYQNILCTKNKNARNKALDEIRTELFKLGLAASIAEIKAKFNNLRTNFLAQHRKYLKSLKSGAGSDDIEKPSLWYYEYMLFVAEHFIPRCSQDSLSSAQYSISDQNKDMEIIIHGDQDECNYIESQDMDTENFESTATNANKYELGSDDDLDLSQPKKIKIQSVQVIKTPDNPSSSLSLDMSTASTSRNSTHYESNGDKKEKIKNKDEGFIIKKPATVLTNLTNVLEKKSNPKPVETPTPNKTDIKRERKTFTSKIYFH